jgi:hypothetical protein
MLKKAFFFIFILFGIPPAAPQPWFDQRSKFGRLQTKSEARRHVGCVAAKGLKKNKQPRSGGRALRRSR